jgi:G3E family GTPase
VLQALLDVLRRLVQHLPPYDQVLIETSGLAHPGVVAQTLFADEGLYERARLAGIVTVVDALHVWRHLDDPLVQQQVALADVVLLSKTDLVTPVAVQSLQARLGAVNASARIGSMGQATDDAESILGASAFELDGIRSAAGSLPPIDSAREHGHDATITSVAISTPGDLVPERLRAWLSRLAASQRAQVYRLKGILSIQGRSERYVLQGVHMVLDGRPGRPWGDEPRHNRLVLIGRHLDRVALEQAFAACLA